MSLFSLFMTVSILSISFMKSKLSVLGGLYIIIIDTFLFELSSVSSISIIILLKIELNFISFLPQNPFLTAQSTQIKSVISVPIKDSIHHYPRALFNDIHRVGTHFNDIPGPGRSLTTYPGHFYV